MRQGVVWYRHTEGIYPRQPDAPPDPGAVLLGISVLDDSAVLTVREILDA